MVKSTRDEVQALELIGEFREEFCIFFAGLLSSRHNFELSAPWSRTPCRSSDYIRDALQNSKYCRGHWGGEWHLQWNFSMFLMSSVSLPQKGIFNNSFPIALESGILPEFWLKVRAVRISNLISSPDIMDIILCRTDFWKYVLSYFPCTIHPLESARALAVGQVFCVTAGSKSQSNSQGG